MARERKTLIGGGLIEKCIFINVSAYVFIISRRLRQIGAHFFCRYFFFFFRFTFRVLLGENATSFCLEEKNSGGPLLFRFY